MIDPKDNPPAFANSVSREEIGMDRNGNSVTNVVQTLEGGMTLLDYFAKEAMFRNPSRPRNLWQFIRWALGFTYSISTMSDDENARQAYTRAEAMLAERKRRMGGGE